MVPQQSHNEQRVQHSIAIRMCPVSPLITQQSTTALDKILAVPLESNEGGCLVAVPRFIVGDNEVYVLLQIHSVTRLYHVSGLNHHSNLAPLFSAIVCNALHVENSWNNFKAGGGYCTQIQTCIRCILRKLLPLTLIKLQVYCAAGGGGTNPLIFLLDHSGPLILYLTCYY